MSEPRVVLVRNAEHTSALDQLLATLRYARSTAKFTQAEVAQRLGKPPGFVAKYERGERRLDVVEFVDVCRVIGVDPVKMTRRVYQIADKAASKRRF